MQSKATTVDQYLAALPDDRRRAIEAVRKVILKSLDKTYEEGMQYGMIGYFVPHHAYPAGYHCDPRQPLPFAGLASQKNYMSLYLMGLYADEVQTRWFQDAWAKAGRKLDMGKSCIRFKKLEELALDVVAEAIQRVPAKKHIESYEKALAGMKSRSPRPAKSTKKSAKPTKKSTNAQAAKKKAKSPRK